jgi:hypothetical protein
MVEKKSKRSEAKLVDLRPMIKQFTVFTTKDGETALRATLPADSANYLNPEYLAKALGLTDYRINRTKVLLLDGETEFC